MDYSRPRSNSSGVGSKSELLNVLSEVKARVQDKLGIVDFPMPQFILIGKQSVGKSRLIESLAGETFNFISGTLGSRRPTVLEFRNVAAQPASRWFVRDRQSSQWGEHAVSEVMKIIGDAHEELGETVSREPVYIRIESPTCVDMQIVDLPGFREFAMDQAKQDLGKQIEELVMEFMQNPKNVMLCVEQAGDAATMSTLARCRHLDPKFERTVLIRNKLDKYYDDLTPENVEPWMKGFGDLPEHLMANSYSMTLPWWKDGSPPPKPFAQITDEMNARDVQTLQSKGLGGKLIQHVGFRSFVDFMDKKVEQMFSDAIDPVLNELKSLSEATVKKEQDLDQSYTDTDPSRILSTTRDCGSSFAKALSHVMEGIIGVPEGQVDMEEELRAFHEYHQRLGSTHFMMLPCEEFSGLDDYIHYLRSAPGMATFDQKISGGAQFRRMMHEVEIFLRFSEVAADTKKRDVIQARGVSMTSLTWRDVIVKLLSAEAHVPLYRRVQYVGERITWFFESQKAVCFGFMDKQAKDPHARSRFSPLFGKHIKIIASNAKMQDLIYQTYDRACRRQLQHFVELFQNMLTSTFANPWAFLKGGSTDTVESQSGMKPEDRIPQEISSRSDMESILNRWLQDIPTEAIQVDTAVDQVQKLVLRIYGLIRSQVCDQVELFAESFFKIPMLRALEADMADIELSDQDKQQYEERRTRLQEDKADAKEHLKEIKYCMDQLDNFKIKCETRMF
jgi:GTP-binding protein EngB required for normal cell division